MQCPIDGTQLVMSERNGVEIDYCPQCRGVWLDRGELDKIIERSAVPAQSPARPSNPGTRPGYTEYSDRSHGGSHKGSYKKSYKKRRVSSFLEDIFDFD